jgi:hypothetical protein
MAATSDTDIYGAAKLLIDQHGEDALFSDQLVALGPGRSRSLFIFQCMFDHVHHAQYVRELV